MRKYEEIHATVMIGLRAVLFGQGLFVHLCGLWMLSASLRAVRQHNFLPLTFFFARATDFADRTAQSLMAVTCEALSITFVPE